MPLDPAVSLALIASISGFAMGLLAVAGQGLGIWNQMRISREQMAATAQLFENQQKISAQQRAWDIQDREDRHTKTIKAVDVIAIKADKAYNEANHTKEQIIELHEENKELHKDIGAVLEVAKAVRHATGEHKPLGKADIVAVAEGVVQAIGELEPPLVKADIPTVAKEVAQAIRRTGPPSSGD